MKKNLEELITKHQKALPRYTSYPPAGKWNQKENRLLWFEEIKSVSSLTGVDLYIHIPYCESLCYYCGCNRTISKNKQLGDEYLSYLKKEFELYQQELNTSIKIHSIHLGGGTPNFLTAEQLEDLFSYFLKHHHGQILDIAIEIDPRTLTKNQVQVFKKYRVKKVSFGIQDFDQNVQIAINRVQPYELVKEMVQNLRLSIPEIEINFDLIYGLPKQSLESIMNTLELVMNLAPDTIAFYSYAHLPQRLKNQKLIKNEDLKSGIAKLELFKLGREFLLSHGYSALGLDHFAKVGTSLDLAKKEKKLTRNFMGHTVSKSQVILGLGSSSISSGKNFIYQNDSNIKVYKEMIDQDRLYFKNVHQSSDDDKKRKELINKIMCEQVISNTDLDEVSNSAYLDELFKDGVFIKDETGLKINGHGIYFLRNIASCFDRYLGSNIGNKFSSSI